MTGAFLALVGRRTISLVDYSMMITAEERSLGYA
jgi:hypothetical protein